jgi:hypothetical protein
MCYALALAGRIDAQNRQPLDSLQRSTAGYPPATRPALARNGISAPSPRKPCIESSGVWKETASGVKDERTERKKVLALTQARDIDTILVTELTRWGRYRCSICSTPCRICKAWNVLLVAQTGLQFDLRSAQGKLIASLALNFA